MYRGKFSLPLITSHGQSVGGIWVIQLSHFIFKYRISMISMKSHSPPDSSHGCFLHQDKVFCRRELDSVGKPQSHHQDFHFFCYCVIFKEAKKKALHMSVSENRFTHLAFVLHIFYLPVTCTSHTLKRKNSQEMLAFEHRRACL